MTSIEITDLIKYGWVLFLTIIPKAWTTISTKFKNLDKRDEEMLASLTTLQRDVAILDTKLDQQTTSMGNMENNMRIVMELVTELRVTQGILAAESNSAPR